MFQRHGYAAGTKIREADMGTEKPQRLLQKLKEKKKPGKDQFVICILTGILLLVIAMPTSEKRGEKTSESGIWDSPNVKIEESRQTQNAGVSEKTEKIDSTEEYEHYMENKLEQAISAMEGAGRVKVMITANASRELVVAKDTQDVHSSTAENDSEGGRRTVDESNRGEESIYRKESDGSSSPYVVKTLQPVIEGVVVITEGGDRPEVSRNITEAIVALFDIEPNKIKVVKMKSE